MSDRTSPARVPWLAFGLVAATVGFFGLGVGLWLDAPRTLVSYLVAFAWSASLAVGCLTLVMVGQMTGAGWFVVLRRPVEAVAATLPLLAVLLLPIVTRADLIYPWAS